MRKLLVTLVGALVMAPAISHAALFGFLDGTLYDESGKLKYICFLNNECLDAQNNITTRAALGLASVENPSQIPQSPTPAPAVEQPSQPSTQPSQPTQPVGNAAPPAPAYSPFSGAPYLIGEYDNWNSERTVNNKYAVLGINLTKAEKSTSDIYGLYCTNQATGTTSKMDVTRPGATSGKVDYTKRVGDVITPSSYSCVFKFTLPEGTFTSETLAYELK